MLLSHPKQQADTLEEDEKQKQTPENGRTPKPPEQQILSPASDSYLLSEIVAEMLAQVAKFFCSACQMVCSGLVWS